MEADDDAVPLIQRICARKASGTVSSVHAWHRPPPRPAMGRRGARAIAVEARGWRCSRCADPDTGQPPLEFVDAQLMKANETALATAWRERYGEALPESGRPGRKTDTPRTERIAVLLTPDELDRVDARRGAQSRLEFLREMIRASAAVGYVFPRY